MLHSRITSKSQTTIPKAVRKALGVAAGDTLTYEIEGDQVIVRRAARLDPSYLRSLQTTLSEWETAEDRAAYDDL